MVTGFSAIITTALSFVNKYWILISILAATFGASWYLANEILVKPRDFLIEQQRIEIAGLKEKVQDQDLVIEKIDYNNRSRLLPNLSIKIINPKNGDKVSVSTIIRGTFLGELQKEWYMWVIINPRTVPGLWWPQAKRIEPMNEQWSVQAWVVDTSFFHINKEFDIAIVLVNKTDDQYYSDYMKKGVDTGEYPGILLPDSAIIMDMVTVTKK